MTEPLNPNPTLWQSNADGSKKAYYDQSVIDDYREHIGEQEKNFARYVTLTGAYIKRLEEALATIREQLNGHDHDGLVTCIDEAFSAKPGQGDHYDPPMQFA